jgi:hypothetical protein
MRIWKHSFDVEGMKRFARGKSVECPTKDLLTGGGDHCARCVQYATGCMFLESQNLHFSKSRKKWGTRPFGVVSRCARLEAGHR